MPARAFCLLNLNSLIPNIDYQDARLNAREGILFIEPYSYQLHNS